ncbi:MAG: hypothetical protein ICV84_17310 [Flavisolibacter sp.]|nr:hypothetical protein [Flavisolibacter sp.]
MRIFSLLLFLFISFFSQSQKFITRFEQSNGTQTPTYFEVIDWWKKLDASSSIVQMNEFGTTDAGYP